MTEWTRLINYSLYGFFRAMNTIKKHRKKFLASLRKRSFQVMFTELKCIWRFNQNHKTQFPLTMRNVDPNWYTCISALPTFFVFSLLFQLDLARKEYWQPFLLAHRCDDSILASATVNSKFAGARYFTLHNFLNFVIVNIHATSAQTIVMKQTFQSLKTHCDCMSIIKEINSNLVLKSTVKIVFN